MLTGGLWLAYRLQALAIAFLNSPEGKAALAKAETILGVPPYPWLKAMGSETQPAPMDRIESVLAERLVETIGVQTGRFNLYAVAGHLLEQARAAARRPPQATLPDGPLREPTPGERLADALAEPVRNAELAEARARFAKLSPDETAKRFEVFKLQLLRLTAQVAPSAPLGFEPFCQLLESILYPYPNPLEWIRPFVKPVWTNASQSPLFQGRNTPDLVNQRYEQLRKTKQGNPVVVELARAFAMELCRAEEQPAEAQSFLEKLDLVSEFGWPSTVEDMRNQWSNARA